LFDYLGKKEIKSNLDEINKELETKPNAWEMQLDESKKKENKFFSDLKLYVIIK
jgi:hypothetical protein